MPAESFNLPGSIVTPLRIEGGAYSLLEFCTPPSAASPLLMSTDGRMRASTSCVDA